jgi:adenylate cyclase
MPPEKEARADRRLAAILAADVAGYSRLMNVDEEGTLSRLKAHRREILDPKINEHRGRIVKTTGDGMLVEFSSVLDAVRCSVEIQHAMVDRNIETQPKRRIEFRIGINIGDIIIDGGDIFGEGVNIAARLETLAKPGEIWVSGVVKDQIGDRAKIAFEDLGEHALKNIAQPVRVYRVLVPLAERSGDPAAGPKTRSVAKPSIAVLPLTNMSSDPEQEFFVDGMTEDILTELSRFRDLFVISRNSVMAYKGKAINVLQVARELGVQYILEGSVRRAGNRVRVTVQLIDAELDGHIWAERYDRQIDDIFDLQDELTRSIVSILPGRLEAAAAERIKRKRPDSMVAYEHVLAAKVLHHRSSRATNTEALQLIDRAIELDPRYAHAHAWRACILGQQWAWGWSADRTATEKAIMGELEIALSLDENDSDVHRILAAIWTIYRNLEKAAFHEEQALRLNPNDDLIVVQKGEILTWFGRADEGIEWIRRAMRLNPFHPARFWGHLGRAYFVARRYAEAVEALRNVTLGDVTTLGLVAGSHAMLGDAEAAQSYASQILKREPGFSSAAHVASLYYVRDEDRAHHREALRAATLPL